MAKTRKWLGRSLMALAGILALAAGGTILLGSNASADKDWACPEDRLAMEVFDLAPGGGYETRKGALTAEAKVLARDGVANSEELAGAADAASVEGDSARLVIDGSVVADVSFAELSDGTWTIGTAQYCSPPPDDGGNPGATPSAADQGES